MLLTELFTKQTGLNAPINMPVSTIYKTDTCNSLGCTENCPSCWNGTVKDETQFVLKPNFIEKMDNFKIKVINLDHTEHFENCFGDKV